MTNALEKVPGSVELHSAEYDWYKVSVRGNGGKVHRALANSKGYVEFISCKCPGSQNGSLRNKVTIISNGWGVCNCGN